MDYFNPFDLNNGIQAEVRFFWFIFGEQNKRCMIPVFETERLTMKPTDEEDAPFLFYLMNTPKWLKFIGNRDITSFAKAKTYIQQRMIPQYQKLGFGNFTLIRSSDQKKIGTCGLFQRTGLPGLDIGFALLPSFERQGYGFEAAQRIVQAGFTDFGLDSIYAITALENYGSQKLLSKLGMAQLHQIQLPPDDEKLWLFAIHKAQALLPKQVFEKDFLG